MSGRDPVLLALILADNVVPDPNSGKNYVLGTITQLYSKSLPAHMNQISLYLCVGDAHECSKPTIEVVHLQSEKTLLRRELPALPERAETGTLELSISLGGVEFPEFGAYDFRVWIDGKFIGGRKFTVLQWPDGAPGR